MSAAPGTGVHGTARSDPKSAGSGNKRPSPWDRDADAAEGGGGRSRLLKPLVYLNAAFLLSNQLAGLERKEQRLEAARFASSPGRVAPIHSSGPPAQAPSSGPPAAATSVQWPPQVFLFIKEKCENCCGRPEIFSPEIKQCLSISNPKDKLAFFYTNVKEYFVKDRKSERPNFWQACHFNEMKDRKMTKHQQTEEQFSRITCWETEHRNYPRLTITHGSPAGQVHSLSLTLNFEKQTFLLHGVIS